jgi:hypothetical protein
MTITNISFNYEPKDSYEWVQQVLSAEHNPAEKALADKLMWYPIFGMRYGGQRSILETVGLAVEDPSQLRSNDMAFGGAPDPRLQPPPIPKQAAEWGQKFIWQIMKELRKVICEKGHGGIDLSEYKSYPKALSVALAGVVMNAIGVKEPMALGIATLVLIALGNATKNAFCTMTDEEVAVALKS